MILQRHFGNEINSLSPEEFVVSIYTLLKDEGYRVEFGPVYGKDSGVDLLGETKDGLPFICQCKITQNKYKLKSDFSKSILTAITSRKEIESLPLLNKIIFASKVKVEQLPEKEEKWFSEIYLEICKIDNRYCDKPINYTAIYSDKISLLASTLPQHYQGTRNYLLKRIYNFQSSDEDLFMCDLLPHEMDNNQKITKLLSRINGDLSGIDVDLFCEDIINTAGELIFNDIRISSVINKFAIKNNSFSSHLLSQIVRLTLSETIIEDEIIYLLTAAPQPNQAVHETFFLPLTRYLRSTIYHNPNVFFNETICNLLLNFAENDLRWQRFLCDIYYRNIIGTISLPESLKKICLLALNNYIATYPDHPISIVKNYIENTVDSVINNINGSINNIYLSAKKSKDAIDVKWTLLAFNRIAAFIVFDDEIENIENERIKLIVNFPSLTRSSNRQIIYYELRKLLFSLIKSVSKGSLVEFEKYFVSKKGLLHQNQITILQVNYISLLYSIVSRTHNLDDLPDSLIWNYFKKGRNPGSTSILSNKCLSYSLSTPISFSKKDLLLFYEKYSIALVKGYINPIIKNMPLAARQFRFISDIQSANNSFSDTVQTSLGNLIELGDHIPTSTWPSICDILKPYFKSANSNKCITVARKSLECDVYSIIRSANSISKALYVSFYYGSPDSKKDSLELFSKLKNITKLGSGRPRLFWAYYAGVHLENLNSEIDYLYALSDLLNEITDNDVLLSVQEQSRLKFSELIITVAKNFKNSSIFALLCIEEIINPEIWNIFATSLFNISNFDKIRIDMSVRLYGLARLLTTGNTIKPEKYCYNYIRAKARYYRSCAYPLNFEFIDCVIKFLCLRESRQFHYRNDAISEFSNLLIDQAKSGDKMAQRNLNRMREKKLIKSVFSE